MRWFKLMQVAFVGTAICLVLLPEAAHATTPERGTFREADQGTDPAGTTCAFPVYFSQVEYGFYDAFSDASGNFLRVQIHTNYDATISANGHVLRERDTFTRTIFADGTMRDVGLTVHILSPSGLVIRDAGQIVYSDTQEDVSNVNGPHPQLFGANFCADLT
jgi:hypothetical protein